MGRRANNEGTICQRKDGRWCAAITMPNGKRKWFYGKEQRDVLSKLTEARSLLQRNMLPEPSRITFGQWLDSWLVNHSKIENRPKTYENYEMFVCVHIKPDLGDILLQRLTTSDIQRFYNRKLKSGRADGKKGGLSPRSIHIMHNIINQALKQALLEGKVYRNTVVGCTLPPQKKKEAVVFTPEQQSKFVEAAENDRLGAAFLLLLATGMRRGEVLGLHWDDVDLEKGTIYIHQQLLQVKRDGKYVLELLEPKSAKSNRVIPINEETVDLLKHHKSQQEADSDLVFCTEDGKPLHPSNFNRAFKKLLKDNKLPKVKLHTLRHTFATRAFEEGVDPKIVQEILGHAQESTTRGIYTHVLDRLKKEAMDKINIIKKPSIKKA